jgi:hypothetical protein
VSGLTPCPYHKPAGDCGHEKQCPLYLFGEYVICTALTIQQIAMVTGWVKGSAQGQEEPAEQQRRAEAEES